MLVRMATTFVCLAFNATIDAVPKANDAGARHPFMALFFAYKFNEYFMTTSREHMHLERFKGIDVCQLHTEKMLI